MVCGPTSRVIPCSIKSTRIEILPYSHLRGNQIFCRKRPPDVIVLTSKRIMLRIIIADDHVHIRKGIVQLLEEEFDNLYIEEAGNGEELFGKVSTGYWDLVISDMVMPGGNGLEALKKIKQEKKDLPVIIVSTYPADQYKLRVIEAGADDFISKDTFSSQLIPSIRRILST